jgi:hypothetical protein
MAWDRMSSSVRGGSASVSSSSYFQSTKRSELTFHALLDVEAVQEVRLERTH